MKKNKRLSVEKHQNKVGFILLIPYMIGLIYFFIIPLIKTIYFSFNDVSIRTGGGLEYIKKGFENYKYILFKDADFVKTVGDSLSKLLYTVPIILIFSIFVAILLNQQFKGRMLMRGLKMRLCAANSSGRARESLPPDTATRILSPSASML